MHINSDISLAIVVIILLWISSLSVIDKVLSDIFPVLKKSHILLIFVKLAICGTIFYLCKVYLFSDIKYFKREIIGNTNSVQQPKIYSTSNSSINSSSNSENIHNNINVIMPREKDESYRD